MVFYGFQAVQDFVHPQYVEGPLGFHVNYLARYCKPAFCKMGTC